MTEDRYSPNPNLTPDQHEALNLIVQGHSDSKTADILGIHRNTIGYWRTNPDFAREANFAKTERTNALQDAAIELATQAISVLKDILNNEKASPSVKLRAALKILDLALSPNPKPMKAQPVSHARLEAFEGQTNLLQSLVAEEETTSESEKPAQTAQIAQTDQPSDKVARPIRRQPEPSRNTPCPCKSGLKYKRCCWLKKTHPTAA